MQNLKYFPKGFVADQASLSKNLCKGVYYIEF